MKKKAAEFYDLVSKLRHAQNVYFRTKTRNDLLIAKDYERRVDAMIDEIARTPSLFDHEVLTEAM